MDQERCSRTWNTVAWNGFIQNFWIIVDNGKHELVVNLRRICQGLPCRKSTGPLETRRWWHEKWNIVDFMEIYGPKGRPCWSCPSVTEQDEVVEMVYNYFFITVESWWSTLADSVFISTSNVWWTCYTSLSVYRQLSAND